MCHEQWECGVSLPPTSLSTLLQTELELLHPPKAQPGTNQGVPGGFGVPDQHSTAAGSTKSTTLTVPSSRGCHRDTTLLPPPASPALRHTRRGHSHGSKAIPKSGTGGQQKPQSNEPPTPCSSAETPTRCPGSAGTGHPPAKGTDECWHSWHSWHSLSGPNRCPWSPQGGDTGSSQRLAGSGTLLQVSNWCSQITIR